MTILLQGLDTMNDDMSAIRVLYSKVKTSDSTHRQVLKREVFGKGVTNIHPISSDMADNSAMLRGLMVVCSSAQALEWKEEKGEVSRVMERERGGKRQMAEGDRWEEGGAMRETGRG